MNRPVAGIGMQGYTTLFALLIFLSQVLLAEEAERFIVHKDLVYSEPHGLTLDLFVPEQRDDLLPTVIVIQGGGFRPQDGQRFRPFAEYLANHGYAAALISYRGRPDVRYRDTIADTKAAVRFIRKVSDHYSLDPARIGATGRSAGGTLTGMLAVTGGMEGFEGEGGNNMYSSRIQAAVAFCGVFDFVARFTDDHQVELQPNVQTKILDNGEWIDPEFSPSNKDWIQASAITHVDKDDAPTLFLHCKDDATVPWLQSEALYVAMKEAGVSVSKKYYKTGGHGFRNLGDAPMEAMVAFFDQTL